MTYLRADRVKETTSTVGIGAVVLNGPMVGSRRFSDVCSIGDTFPYGLQGVSSSGAPSGDWETGIGTYSALNTITRTTVQSSSNGGALVNLSALITQIWIGITTADFAGIAANAATAAGAAAYQSQVNASGSASAAATSASSASTSASASASSATGAASSAAAATASASDANTSAVAATTQAGNAAMSAASLAAGLASFRGKWLGAFATDPTLDGNGAEVTQGAEYFNTVSLKIRIYGASSWGDYDATAQAQTTSATLSATAAAASSAASSASAAASLASQGASALSATAAATQANTATAASVAALAARDAALIGAGVYTTEPLGRAAVADGVAFKVQGTGDVAAYEYRRTNSSISALIATYPSSSAVANANFLATVEINKFNPALIASSSGYVNTSGGVTGSTYKNSGYQSVLPSTAYLLSGVEAGTNWGLAAYDANKAFLTMLPASGQNITAIPQTFTTPPNCAYLRWTIQVASSPDYTNRCLLEQTVSIYPSAYAPYIRSVDISQIPTAIARQADVNKICGRVTIKNSERILILGNSYTEGDYVVRGKHYVPLLSMLSNFQISNYGTSGYTLASLYAAIDSGMTRFGFTPTTTPVTYAVIICVQNNSGTSAQYYSDLGNLVRKMETMGAQVILSTEHTLTNDGYVKALKAFAYRKNLLFCDWRTFADATKTVAFSQFQNSAHPGTRATWAYVSGIKPYLDILPSPKKSIKLFRDRSAPAPTIGTTNLFNTGLASNSGFVQLGGVLNNGGSTYNNSGYQPVSGSSLYQLSGMPIGGGWGIAAYDSSNVFITMLPTNGGWAVASPQQFLTPSNCAYLRWTTRFAGTDYTNTIALNTVTLNTSYSGYVGTNLYDDTKVAWGYVNPAGAVATSASSTNPTGFWNSGFQVVLANTSYLLSGIPAGWYFAYYDSNKAVISAQTITASAFITPSNCSYICWTTGFYTGDLSSTCMLEQTTSSTPSTYVSFTGMSKLAYDGIVSRSKIFNEIEIGHMCYTSATESGFDNADIAGTYDTVTDEYTNLVSGVSPVGFGRVLMAEITMPCRTFDSVQIVVNATGISKAYLLNETLLWKEVPIENGVIRLVATDAVKYLRQGRIFLILTGSPAIYLTDIYANYQGLEEVKPEVKVFKDRTVSGSQLLTSTTVNDADTAWTGIAGISKYTPVVSRSAVPEPLPTGITTVREVTSTAILAQGMTIPTDNYKETTVRVKVLCRYFPAYILSASNYASQSLIKQGTYDCADLNVTLADANGSITVSEPIGLWWNTVVLEFVSLGGAGTITISSADSKKIQIAKVELLT